MKPETTKLYKGGWYLKVFTPDLITDIDFSEVVKFVVDTDIFVFGLSPTSRNGHYHVWKSDDETLKV